MNSIILTHLTGKKDALNIVGKTEYSTMRCLLAFLESCVPCKSMH